MNEEPHGHSRPDFPDFEPAPDRAEVTEAGALQRVLVAIYQELAVGLERHLGSREAALEVLQDASAKLAGEPSIGLVRNPRAYLRRMAFNLGRNRRRALSRFVPVDQIVLDALTDEAPSPERSVAASQELARVLTAANEMPEQRRAIFLHRWVEDLSTDDIAALLGIHRRTVQKELELAAAYLRQRMGRPPRSGHDT